MLKQTFLSFKGALGFMTSSSKRDEEDRDSGASSRSDPSSDDDDEVKDHYTSTGILVPGGQTMNQITVLRLRHKEISAEIEEYGAKCKPLRRLCRVFDTKALVRKSDQL